LLVVDLQGEAIVIERLGKFNRILNPGINCLVPFLDSPKQFQWNKTTVDRRGNVISKQETLTRLDLRETVFNFPPQPVYTVDTVQMRVSWAVLTRCRCLVPNRLYPNSMLGAGLRVCGLQLQVNAVMYYRIKDVQKAVYQVDDLTAAVQNVAQAQLKDVFGSKTMSAALQGQKAVNDYLQRMFASVSPSTGGRAAIVACFKNRGDCAVNRPASLRCAALT
jgi:regulator of protease activity HflC (stomatin/prohibitin superfamily)